MKKELEKLRKHLQDLKEMQGPHEEFAPGKGTSRIERWKADVRSALKDAGAEVNEVTEFIELFPDRLLSRRGPLTQVEAEQLRDEADLFLQGAISRLEKKQKQAPGAFGKSWAWFIKRLGDFKLIAEVGAVLVALGIAGTLAKVVGNKPPEKVVQTTAPFDVAWCHPRRIAAMSPPDHARLLGMVTAARPLVMECLVDPRSRASQGTVKVTVETIVDELSGTHRISGENLTLVGQQCIQRVLDEHVPVDQLSSKPAVVSKMDFDHQVTTAASVVSSEDAANAFAGAVRLAQAQWCDCYEGFTSSIPPRLKMTAALKKGQTQASGITLEPTSTGEGEQLARCIQPKMTALTVAPIPRDIDLSLEIAYLHSMALEPAGWAPEWSYAQRNARLHQLSADVSLALSARINAEAEYQKLRIDVPQTIESIGQIKNVVLKRNAVLAAFQKQQEAIKAKGTHLEQLVDVALVLEKRNLLQRSEVLRIQRALKEAQDDLTRTQQQQQLRLSDDLK